MTIQKYSKTEAINRILRSLGDGTIPSSDAPGTLPGEIYSSDEALSRLAELLEDSLDGVSAKYPTSLNDQLIGSIVLANENPNVGNFLLCNGSSILKTQFDDGTDPVIISEAVPAVIITGSHYLSSVAYDEVHSKFIVGWLFGTQGGKILLSDDNGENWTPFSGYFGAQYPHVQSASGTIAVFSNEALSICRYSNDGGSTWSTGTMRNSVTWQKLLFGNGKHVAIASNGTYNVSNDNCVTWYTGSTVLQSKYEGIGTPYFAFDKFFIGGSYFSDVALFSSSDLLNWTTGTFERGYINLSANSSAKAEPVFYNEDTGKYNVLLVIPQTNSFAMKAMFESSDGGYWSFLRYLPEEFYYPSTIRFSAVSGRKLIVGMDSLIALSEDYGVTWKSIPLEKPFSSNSNQFTYYTMGAFTSAFQNGVFVNSTVSSNRIGRISHIHSIIPHILPTLNGMRYYYKYK